MTKLLFLSVVLLLVTSCHSQNNKSSASKPDSIKSNKQIITPGDSVRLLNERYIEFCNVELKNNPNNPLMYYQRGKAEYELRQFQTALSDFSKSLAIDSTDTDAFYYRALCEYEMHNLNVAKKEFEILLKKYPDNPEFLSGMAVVLLTLKDYDKALIYCNESLKIDSTREDAYQCRGSVYLIRKEYEKSILDFNEAIKLKPNSAEYRNLRADALIDLKRYDEAYKDVIIANSINKANASGYYALGKIFFSKNNADSACYYFNKASVLGIKTDDKYKSMCK